MARAVFRVKSVVQRWRPPFNSTAESEEVTVGEGSSFDKMEKIKGSLFKLVKCDGDKALVEFNHMFTLKGHEHPGNRQVWVGKQEEVKFTYLWGEDGITKSLRLREIAD